MDIADVDSLAIGNGVETKEVRAERGNDGDVPADHDDVDDDDVDDDDEDDDDDNDDNDVEDSRLFVSEYPPPPLYYRPPLRRGASNNWRPRKNYPRQLALDGHTVIQNVPLLKIFVRVIDTKLFGADSRRNV